MEYRPIADGQLNVSTVCLGCWALVGDATWGPQDKSDAIATIRAALDAGINFLDTAEGYGGGYSERLIGEALGADRGKVVLASKVSRAHLAPADLTAACEGSLTNLGADRIDIYHIHWPSRDVPVAETVGAMESLVAAGKIGHVAVSNFGPAGLGEILPHVVPVVNQLPYSLLWRAIEYEILPACRSASVPATCYSPLMQGLLTGKFASAADVPAGRRRTRLFRFAQPQARHGEPGAEDATFAAVAAIVALARQAGLDPAAMSLAWLLGRDGVVSVIAGARRVDQVRANAAAGDLALPADVAERLTEITDPLKAQLGPNADMWQSESRIH